MRVAVGSDHGGLPLKRTVVDELRRLGHDVIDKGTFDETSVDYPDFAEAVGMSIITGEAGRGIVLCGSGVGASVAANKMPGIRAAVCHDTYSAHQGVEHDDMNVLTLGASHHRAGAGGRTRACVRRRTVLRRASPSTPPRQSQRN